jgi:hypothetical protein
MSVKSLADGTAVPVVEHERIPVSCPDAPAVALYSRFPVPYSLRSCSPHRLRATFGGYV